jgi:hypothetical protein
VKNKRNGSGGGPHGALFHEAHLTDEAILLFLEDELIPAEESAVDSHVRSCWTCLGRRDMFERSMADFADFQNAFVAPHLPPSPEGKAVFMARLDGLAKELGHPPLLHFWRRNTGQFFKSLFPAQPVWITALLLIAIVVPSLYLLRRQQTMSPSELLNRAAMSGEDYPSYVDQPVVVQKVRIRANGCSLLRTVYHDIGQKRNASRTDVSASREEAIRTEFVQSGLDWDHPLSVERYQHWRETLAVKRDAIDHVGNNLLRLNTKTPSGAIAEASLTIREKDFHPLEESLLLRDDNRIEIAELSYEVVGIKTLGPDILGAASVSSPLQMPLAALGSTLPQTFSSDALLAMTEVQVRYALHDLGADIGEQIDLHPTPSGLVLVKGIVVDNTRKQQLIAALEGIPHTQIEIETVSQADARQQSDSPTTASATVTLKTKVAPLLQARLRQKFPDEYRRTMYVNQTLSLAQGASARAWALNRLAERYSSRQIALLDASSRQSLRSLLSDHLAVLREDINHLQAQIAPILSSSSNTAAANTYVDAPAEDITKPSGKTEDWRKQVRRVYSSVETVNESVTSLLVGSVSGDNDSPEEVEVGLRTTLTQLQTDIKLLEQQIHTPF